MFEPRILQDQSPKLNTGQDQKREDQEKLLRTSASTTPQKWKAVDEEKEKVRIVAELYSILGSLQPGTSQVLKGLSGSDVHRFRVGVINDALGLINALTEKVGNQSIVAGTSESLVEKIDKTNLASSVLEILESLEGVNSAESMNLRRFILSSPIGAYFSESMHRHRFIGTFIRSFAKTHGKGDSVLEDAINRVIGSSTEDAGATFNIYKVDIAAAIKGSTSKFASLVRDRFGWALELLSERIIGTDSPSAWKKRRSIVENQIKQKEKLVVSAERTWYVDLEEFCLDFAECDSKESWEFREELFQNPHVDKNDLLLSIGDLDSESARAFQDRLIKEIFEDKYYIDKAVAAGSEKVPTVEIQHFRESSPLRSLMGKDTELSWSTRRDLVLKYKIPLSYVLATTVSNMTTQGAEKFVEEMTKEIPAEERRQVILSSMSGSELKIVWKEREAIIQELQDSDRLKIRSYGEKISVLSDLHKEKFVFEIRPILIRGGHINRDASTESVVNYLKRLNNDELFEILNGDDGIDFNLSDFLSDVQATYFANEGDESYRLIVASLEGCTSERSRKTRMLMAKAGVPKEAILGTVRGVFTKEAQTLRTDYIRDSFFSKKVANPDSESDAGHFAQVLITNLLLDGPTLEDRFEP